MASFQYNLFSRIFQFLPTKVGVKILFFRRFGYFLNLKSPQTFNEKVQVRKVYCRDPLLTVAADKLASKELIRNLVPDVYIPRTLKVFSRDSEITNDVISTLPKNYVFKANHTSQTIEIIKNGKHLSIDKMRGLARSWLKKNQAKVLGEWAYTNIPPRIFIEEYLDFEGKEPDDYKFFVFNGKVKIIQLDSDRFTSHRRNMFDQDWNDLGFEYGHPRKTPTPDRPDFLDKMIKYAETIGQKFDFVRVDLYFYQGKITFGELTMYPGAGFEKFPSKAWDEQIGQLWRQDNYIERNS